MYKCGDEYKYVPPVPPPPPVFETPTKSYQWSSSNTSNVRTTTFDARAPTTASAASPIASHSKTLPVNHSSKYFSTQGDTVRRHVPKGRIKDLAAAFDKKNILTQPAKSFGNERPTRGQTYSSQSTRYRHNSETKLPEELEVEPHQFLDDSIIDERAAFRESHRVVEQTVEHVNVPFSSTNDGRVVHETAYMAECYMLQTEMPPTALSSYTPSMCSQKTKNSEYNNNNYDDEEEDNRRYQADDNRSAAGFSEFSANFAPSNGQRFAGDRSGSGSGLMASGSNCMTSTPRDPRQDVHNELMSYFNKETSIRDCTTPIRRLGSSNRRQTQAVESELARRQVGQFSAAKKWTSGDLNASSVEPAVAGNVRSMASNFEHKLSFRVPENKPEEFDENANYVLDKCNERENNNLYEYPMQDKNGQQEKYAEPQLKAYFPPISLKKTPTTEPLYAVVLKKKDRQGSGDELRTQLSEVAEEGTTIPEKIDRMFDFVEQHYHDGMPYKVAEKQRDGQEKDDQMQQQQEQQQHQYVAQNSKKAFSQEQQRYHGEKTKRRPSECDLNVPQVWDVVKECPYVSLDQKDNTYQELEFQHRDSFDEMDGDMVNPKSRAAKLGAVVNEPRYSWSPTLATPHAGQSVTEYRLCEREPGAEKVVLNRTIQPSALATSTPIGTVAVRGDADNSFVSSISTQSSADKRSDSKRQIGKLVSAIEITKKALTAAEQELQQGRHKKGRMAELAQLALHRVILVNRERLRLQLDEVKRHQALAVVRHPPPPLAREFKSRLVISSISARLNKNFCHGQSDYKGSFAFLVLMKCRTEVESTGVVTLMANYQTRMHMINFNEHMHFANLPVDFVISVELYVLRFGEPVHLAKSCKDVLLAKCKNILVPAAAQRRAKPRVPSDLPDCEFHCCGRMTLDRSACGDRQFYLDDVDYPLEGTVKILSHCSSLPESIDVEYRGFLKVDGSEGWEKFWAMLNRGIIFLWKSPADEQNDKCPLSQIDLTKCTNQAISQCARDICQQEYSFTIELLINSSPSLMEKKRVLLSADSPDVMNSWLAAINETLSVLRGRE